VHRAPQRAKGGTRCVVQHLPHGVAVPGVADSVVCRQPVERQGVHLIIWVWTDRTAIDGIGILAISLARTLAPRCKHNRTFIAFHNPVYATKCLLAGEKNHVQQLAPGLKWTTENRPIDSLGPRIRAKSKSLETNRICLVLFRPQNRTLGPYLAAVDRILISVMKQYVSPSRATETELLPRERRNGVLLGPSVNRIQLVLFGIQNRTLGPYLAATHRILISVLGKLLRKA
jgi:hypothetical protein